MSSAAPGGVACAACGQPGARQACAGCKLVKYCDRGCQRRHWKQRHRPECGHISAWCGQAEIDVALFCGSPSEPTAEHVAFLPCLGLGPHLGQQWCVSSMRLSATSTMIDVVDNSDPSCSRWSQMIMGMQVVDVPGLRPHHHTHTHTHTHSRYPLHAAKCGVSSFVRAWWPAPLAARENGLVRTEYYERALTTILFVERCQKAHSSPRARRLSGSWRTPCRGPTKSCGARRGQCRRPHPLPFATQKIWCEFHFTCSPGTGCT